MIIVAVVGFGLLVIMAIAVGIIDAKQTPTLRRIAEQRRRDWEARQREIHGTDPGPSDTREDD